MSFDMGTRIKCWSRRWWWWPAIAALMLAAGRPQWMRQPLGTRLTMKVDADGLCKLKGIESDPSLGGLLGYFAGDDPQGVHTFRPIPATTLWVEYHLWGFSRTPYLIVNDLWLIATALALVWFARVLGMPWPPAVGAGVIFMAYATPTSVTVITVIATRHDLVCVLFSILATGMLIRYLEGGIPRDLWAYAGLSLVAYLSKEMAVALLPIAGLLALAKLRETPRRRLATAVGAAVAIAAAWFAWYLVAEARMASGPLEAHTFGGMWALLQRRWPRSVMLLVNSLFPPIYGLQLVARTRPGIWILWYDVFWWEVASLGLWTLMIWLLWTEHRWWLGVIYAWKVCTYLPVLPLSDTWPWYLYMPRALDPLLFAGAAWAGWWSWGIGEYLRRAVSRLHRDTDTTPETDREAVT